MRLSIHHAAAIAIFASVLFISQAHAATNPVQIEVCPTRDKAEQVVQSNGAIKPDGCRIVSVTRLDSPAGPMCVMKFNDSESGGVLGQIKDAFGNSEWWTSCDNVRSP